MEITSVIEGENMEPPNSKTSSDNFIEGEVDFQNLENPSINTIAMAPTNAFVSTKSHNTPPAASILIPKSKIVNGIDFSAIQDEDEPDIIVEEEYDDIDDCKNGTSDETNVLSSHIYRSSSSPSSSDAEQKSTLGSIHKVRTLRIATFWTPRPPVRTCTLLG